MGRARWRDLLAGGTFGNELLTSTTGAVLIALLAVIGVTILQIRTLMWVHLFVGMLLLGPVALKLASTGYRFVRYYAGDGTYRLKGPPFAPLRAIAPVVVLTTLIVFASGVALLIVGPRSRGALLPIHKVSFIAWLIFMALHVLGHLPDLPRALRADFGAQERLDRAAWDRATEDRATPGRTGRMVALAAALTLGAVLAVLCVPLFTSWMHYHPHHH